MGRLRGVLMRDEWMAAGPVAAPAPAGAGMTGRRRFLRGGVALGAGGLLAAAGGLTLAAAVAAPAGAQVSSYSWQTNWRWCSKCQGLFFGGYQGNQGLCAAGGAHAGNSSSSYDYLVNYNVGPRLPDEARPPFELFQSGWRFCQRCLSMAYGANGPGWCPGSGRHDHSISYDYWIYAPGENVDVPFMQPGWRWCGKCLGFAYAGNGPGPCSYDGYHDHRDSFAYYSWFV